MVTLEGVRVRKQYQLGTSDLQIAKGKAEQISRGSRSPSEAAAQIETFAEAARRIVTRQGLEGISGSRPRKPIGDEAPEDANQRMRQLRRWVFPELGHMRVTTIGVAHVRNVLATAIAAGKSKSTIDHIRDDISSVLGDLWRDGVIPENPCKKVPLPKGGKVDRRPRTVPTDAELGALLACDRVEPELHVAVICARTIGGQRTSDLLEAKWERIDTRGWATWMVHRPKTDTWDTHAIPPVTARVLESWWHACGQPGQGPVFPARRGPRTGETKLRGHTWSKRLRRALRAAGVARPGPDGRCVLQHDTTTSRRVDFHSIRRAYVEGLRRANVDPSLSMQLAGHSEWETHMRYDRSRSVLEVPAGALPIFSPKGLRARYIGDIPLVLTAESAVDGLVARGADEGVAPKTRRNPMTQAVAQTTPKLKVAGSTPARRAAEPSEIVDGAPAPANEIPVLLPTATAELAAWEADQHLQLTLSLRAAAISQREKAIAAAREAHATTRYSKDEAAALALTASPCGWTAEQLRNAAFGVTFHGFGKVTRVSPEGVES